jgi:uncharacterized protein YqjF (DUF2071 family)
VKSSEILHAVEHRADPLPRGPWIMHQVWHELLFAHWPVSPGVLRPLIPASMEIDTFEGEAWVGIVPFHMSGVRPRGLPAVSAISSFPELNVRTYVTVNGIPGVYFFSLDAGNPVAVAIARSVFHLPYFNASMQSKTIGDTIHYRSHRTHRGAPAADYIARYRPIAEVVLSRPGSIEAWLTERYYLYTTAGSQLFRGDIHHVRWPLQVAELESELDTMAASHKIVLPDIPPLLHYSLRQDVLIWPLRRIHSA